MRLIIQKHLDKVSPVVNLIYPSTVMQKAIDDRTAKCIFGTLGKPKANSREEFPDYTIVNSSHKCCDLKIMNGEITGEIEILDNPDGLLLSEHLNMVDFRIFGQATFVNNVATEFKIHCVNAVPKGGW
jgi:hypothetical protein